jgi:hypothetical protein
MTLDPDLASVLLAIAFAGAAALPTLKRLAGRRRDLRRTCLECGRRLIMGERACDCDPEVGE